MDRPGGPWSVPSSRHHLTCRCRSRPRCFFWLGPPAGAAGVLGLVVGAGHPPRPGHPPPTQQVTRVGCAVALALSCLTSPRACVPGLGPGGPCPARVELCGGPASRAAWWGCVSNSVFSLCSCCSKAMFSKSLDIAEAHPQFSKEDRYTPCPPIPRPPAPRMTVGLVAGLGLRCFQPSQLWRGRPPASWGRAWARRA